MKRVGVARNGVEIAFKTLGGQGGAQNPGLGDPVFRRHGEGCGERDDAVLHRVRVGVVPLRLREAVVHNGLPDVVDFLGIVRPPVRGNM